MAHSIFHKGSSCISCCISSPNYHIPAHVRAFKFASCCYFNKLSYCRKVAVIDLSSQFEFLTPYFGSRQTRRSLGTAASKESGEWQDFEKLRGNWLSLSSRRIQQAFHTKARCHALSPPRPSTSQPDLLSCWSEFLSFVANRNLTKSAPADTANVSSVELPSYQAIGEPKSTLAGKSASNKFNYVPVSRIHSAPSAGTRGLGRPLTSCTWELVPQLRHTVSQWLDRAHNGSQTAIWCLQP